MESLGQKAKFSIKDGRVTLGDTDITESVDRLGMEIASDGCWLSFQLRAEVDPVEFDFPVESVRQFLGGGGAIETSPAELEQVIVSGTGYGSGENGAGTAVYEWLKAKGVISD